eukprot:m.59384 g.59384  ORF g.59384 m.59384 type:complete len:616 (+) comp13574_c0_seq1:1474-3321(+)
MPLTLGLQGGEMCGLCTQWGAREPTRQPLLCSFKTAALTAGCDSLYSTSHFTLPLSLSHCCLCSVVQVCVIAKMTEARLDSMLNLLEDLGLADHLLAGSAFEDALQAGLASMDFVQLLATAAAEVARLERLEACVSVPQSLDDVEAFVIDLTGFYTELGTSFANIRSPGFFNDHANRTNIVEYTLRELAASRLTASRTSASAMEVDQSVGVSSPDRFSAILTALGLRPAATTAETMQTLSAKISALIAKVPKTYLSPPLLQQQLSTAQWDALQDINSALHAEYTVRRQMLLKRLDVTVQSFKWSDRAKNLVNDIEKTFQPRRERLRAESAVDINDVFFATNDLLRWVKTSNSDVRQNTQSVITKVVIGAVPDRGGRPTETRPSYEDVRFAFHAKRSDARPQREQPHKDRPRGGRAVVQKGWDNKGRGGGGGGGVQYHPLYSPAPAPQQRASPVLPTAEQLERAQLRDEQDAAYREALEKDRAEQRRKREAEEQAALDAALQRSAQDERAHRRAQLPAEPPADGPDVATLAFRIQTGGGGGAQKPGSGRLTRRFPARCPFRTVLDYLTTSDELAGLNLQISLAYPSRQLTEADAATSLADLGLAGRVTLMVRDADA